MSTPKLVMQPQASKVGWLGSQLPLDGTGDFTVTRASTATRINASGLLETVPANVPIIDHSNGCPELVCEPQVTQLLGMTEQFDNAYWTKTGVTVTGGFPSPHVQKPTSAFKIIESGTTSQHGIFAIIPTSGGGVFSFSIIAKQAERRYISLVLSDVAFWLSHYTFDLQTGLVTKEYNRTGASTVYKVNPLAGGYYEISISTTYAFDTNIYSRIYVENTAVPSTAPNNSYLGDGTSGVYIAFPQLQTGSVATSYIPNATTGTVTKVADVITGQTNANNFNSAEGTLFVEMRTLENNSKDKIIQISDGTNNNRVVLYYHINNGHIRFAIVSGGILQFDMPYYLTTINYAKFVVRYKTNNCSLWVNNVKVAENLSNISLTGLNILTLNRLGIQNFEGRIKQIQYYPIALTDAQIQAL